ncbi:MAG: hypothetical protein ACKOC8_01835 [Pirellulales bacterium]
MSEATKREIRDQDVQGLKCLRKIRPLLSRLRTVGTERDRAGIRRLFMDHSCALILMSLFSPAIECSTQRGAAGAPSPALLTSGGMDAGAQSASSERRA